MNWASVVSRQPVIRQISVLWLVSLGGFVGAIGWSLYQDRIERVAHAYVETGNLAHVLEEHALAMIQKIDLAAVDVLGHLNAEDMRVSPGDHLRDSPRSKVLNALLKDKIAGLGEADVINIANAAGDVVYSSQEILPAVNVADRNHFLVVRENPAAGLVFSAPLLSRTLGTWAIVLTRRMSFDDGRFAGAVLVTIQLTSLERFYRSLNIGRHGAVLMRDGEMRLLARHPLLNANMGVAMPDHPLLRQKESAVSVGNYVEISPADGVRRLYSFRKVGQYPLYVLAAFAVEDYLSEWWRHVVWYGLAGLVMVAVTRALAGIARRSIASQIKAERALEQQNEHLERIVEERTRDLDAARAAAEAANQAKSAFLASMSHELRTPLNAILGFAQLMARRGGLSPETERQVAKIERAGSHLLTLINSVLSISRIEAGKVEMVSEPFSIRESIANVAAMIHGDADAKGLEFHIEFVDDVPESVLGDEGHFRQILINLLTNAVKYTDQGRIVLRIARRANDYRFDVVDTGPGIAPEYLERVFQPFFKLESTSQRSEGVGLGLAISREYAVLMGGALLLDSEVGRGSTFSLRVNFVECEKHSEALPVSGYKLDLRTAVPRILVVDDEENSRELARDLLADAGFDVMTVQSGIEAIDRFPDWRPDLILTDLCMPVLDGFDTVRRIRAMPEGRRVKIVALTANVFEEGRKAAFDAGCDAILFKPLDVAGMFCEIAGLLDVKYLHAGERESFPNRVSVDGESLSDVSAEIVRRLKAAAEGLDIAQTREVIGEIRVAHPGAAAAIESLADEFRFDRIVRLCDVAMTVDPVRGGGNAGKAGGAAPDHTA